MNRFTTLFSWLAFLLFTAFTNDNTDNVQWASRLVYQFNNYSDAKWSGWQALGAPDAWPLGADNPKAFKLKSESEYGTIIVSFPEPQVAQQVVIVESNLPGRISEVSIIDDQGEIYDIYQNRSSITEDNFRAFCLGLPKLNIKVKDVRVVINTLDNSGWSQIDAIGLSNFNDIKKLQDYFLDKGINRFHFEMAYISKKENLGEIVNSKESELKPIISPDGKTLYFSRAFSDENVGGRKDAQDIYVSTLENGNWSIPKNVGAPLNNEEPNGVASISPDGNQLLLLNDYSDATTNRAGASISRRTANGWSTPKPLNVNNYYNKSEFADFYMANNNKILLMAIERRDTRGLQDLYVSFLTKQGLWTEPKNLGKTINSGQAEYSPFLASDNKTLYFTSEGHGGLGKGDIFYTKRLDDSWTNWSDPINLGAKVNSRESDAYYSVSAEGDYAYFVKSNDRKGRDRDIYRIPLPKQFKPEPVLMITGRVLDSETGLPVSSKIIFEDLEKNMKDGFAHSQPGSGEYSILLTRGKKYGYLAVANGYLSQNENIDLEEIEGYTVIKKDLYLVPIAKGRKLALNNLLFQQSKAKILPESHPELLRLVEVMKEYPDMRIKLTGHTDNQGVRSDNYRLSEERVKVVKAFLTDRGIGSNRIELSAAGSRFPIADNSDKEARKLNRRVEIEILSE
ncbi:MAG: OmpA family protein [Bacteroidota bacterium]